jgi:hypothetical protein
MVLWVVVPAAAVLDVGAVLDMEAVLDAGVAVLVLMTEVIVR